VSRVALPTIRNITQGDYSL